MHFRSRQSSFKSFSLTTSSTTPTYSISRINILILNMPIDLLDPIVGQYHHYMQVGHIPRGPGKLYRFCLHEPQVHSSWCLIHSRPECLE